MYDYEKEDPHFVQDLLESERSVEAIARYLRSQGLAVIIHPTHVRPSFEDMHAFSDGGDLSVLQNIEVKQRKNITFNSRENYPYSTVIVTSVRAHDRLRPMPAAYFIVNADCTGALMIDVKRTYQHWLKTDKHDKSKGRTIPVYECPKNYTRYVEL